MLRPVSLATLSACFCSLPIALLLAVAALTAGGGCEKANQTADVPTAEGTAEQPPEQAETPPEPRRAEAGVGKQGQSLEDETGAGAIIAQPARTLFDVQQRAVFEIQIPQAMKLFEATEGRKPQSHEEFMQRIIQANRIQLPELPEGQQYRYDPEKGELWVYPVEE